MKKFLLLAGIAVMALCANAQNPFAYNLTIDSTNVTKGKTVTVGYTLNAAAESGYIGLMKISTTSVSDWIKFDLDSAQLVKGDHKVTISTENLEAGCEYGWAVQVTGAKIDAAKEIFSDLSGGGAHQYWSPYGVACDNDPTSAHFGRVLITEAQGNMGSSYFTKASGVGVGLYEYDPQGNPVKNAAGTYGYNPFNWGAGTYQSASSAQSQKMNLKKVRIAEDGRIFIGVLDCVNNPIYTVDPENLGKWSPLFDCDSIDTDETGYAYKEGKMIAAPSAAFDIYGAGEDLKLVNLGSKYGQSYSYGNYTCYEYPIGGNYAYSAEPTNEVFPLSMQYTISAQSVSVAYDADGNIWYAQYRGTPTDAQPAIKHASYSASDGEWVEDYSDITTVVRGGGIAFNKDYTLLAIPKNNFSLGVYSVSKDDAGKPVLTEKYAVTTTSIRGFNDICFDYANNIYSCDNGKEVMQQIQLPLEDPTTMVPCNYGQLINVVEPVVPTAVTDINTNATVKAQKVIENGQVIIVVGDKKYNTMGVEVK